MELVFLGLRKNKTTKFLVGFYVVSFVLSMTLQPLVFSVSATGGVGKDFSQCSNKNNILGECKWIGSIIQQSNSKYFEGMTVPQRLLLTSVPSTSSNIHTLTFSHQVNKSTVHAYDFVTGYNQGNSPAITLNACNDFGGSLGTTCSTLRSGSNTFSTDIPDAMGTVLGDNVANRVSAFETLFGNRQIKLYGNSAITAATLTFNGYDNGDEGYALYTLTWTSASTNILLEMAGHLAISGDGTGISYGVGKGSANINGGPYHFKLDKLDNGSLGSQDNQIKGADVLILPPQPATLIVKKVVDNGNGGTKTYADFSFQVNAGSPVSFEAAGQNNLTVDAGTYSVTEPAVAGYSTTYDNCSNIVLAEGGTVTCTITNDDQPATLKVIKHVVNNNNGTSSAGDFTMNVNGTNVSNGSFSGDEDGVTVTLDAGSYAVTESGPGGYAETDSADCSGTIANGESKTCTITNDDLQGGLTVVKLVTNNNGGEAGVSDFTLHVTDANQNDIVVTSGQAVQLNPGTYTVSETGGPSGYIGTIGTGGEDNCDSNGTVTIQADNSYVCTITNDDQPGTLTVKKVVNGSDVAPDNFSFIVNDGDPVSFEADGQNDLTVDAGTYTVTEPAVTNYDTSYQNCSEVSVGNGGAATCTITNTYNPPEVPVADVELTKDVNDQTVDNGQQVSYTINVINHGPDTATSVEVTDALPAGLTYASSSATVGSYNSGTNTWDVGTLTNGQTATLTLYATVTATQGTILNAADVTIDPNIDINTQNNHDEINITVNQPECTSECSEPTPTPTPTPMPPGGGGGGGGGCYGNCGGYVPTPTPTPTPVVTPSTGEVLGASTTILPKTSMPMLDQVIMSFFSALALTSMMMLMIGYGAIPKKLEDYLN